MPNNNDIIYNLQADKQFIIGAIILIVFVASITAVLVYAFLTSDFAKKKIFHQAIASKEELAENKKTSSPDIPKESGKDD